MNKLDILLDKLIEGKCSHIQYGKRFRIRMINGLLCLKEISHLGQEGSGAYFNTDDRTGLLLSIGGLIARTNAYEAKKKTLFKDKYIPTTYDWEIFE